MPPMIDDTTVALLNRLLGGRSPVIPPVESRGDSQKNFIRLDLPAAASAQYSFRLWFYQDCDQEISAQPLQQNGDHDYFWYRPFELAVFGDSEGNLVKEFCSELEVLLTHETRIVQRKGLLFGIFAVNTLEEKNGKQFRANPHCGSADSSPDLLMETSTCIGPARSPTDVISENYVNRTGGRGR